MSEETPASSVSGEAPDTISEAPPGTGSPAWRRLPKWAIVAIAGGSIALLVALIAVVVTRLGSEPVAAPSESSTAAVESPSASPKPSASTSPSPSIQAAATRDPFMADAEAIERAENPRTGEVWLANPQEIPEPAWARDTSYFATLGGPVWYLVGHRAGNEIISQGLSGYLIEVSPDAGPKIVIAPYPYEVPSVEDWRDAPIPLDTDTFYDSLAVPATAETPDGSVINIRDRTFGRDDLGGATVEAMATYGGNTWAKLSRPADGGALEAPRIKALVVESSQEVGWVLLSPYGAIHQPRFDPAAQPISWKPGYGATPDRGFVDFYDNSCGNSTEFDAQIPAGAFGPWMLVGESPSGDILAPMADSPLAQAAYQDKFELAVGPDGPGDNPFLTSLESFVAQPGVIAIPTRGGGDWWIMVNMDASTRLGC